MNANQEEQNQQNPEAKPALNIAAAEENHAAVFMRDSNKASASDSEIRSVITRSSKKLNGRVTALDRWLLDRVFDIIGRPPFTLVLWDGQVAYGAGMHNVPVVTLCDRGVLWRLLVDPELYFGDMYSAGRIRFEGDLAGFLTDVFNAMADYGTGNKIRRFFTGLLHQVVGNTLDRARQNIYHHYDLSNDFYQKWLDTEAMQYTCAYFPDPAMSLEQAQVAKLHHVCRKLQLKPGDEVVEAGCGWGGLARFMAQYYGVTVRAYNISREQIAYARRKAGEMGLDGRVEYIEDDYRNIEGEYDVFVSVGMLEHVGFGNYRALGDVINRSLRQDGRGLVHSIGRNRPGQMSSWIERRIFPGAYAPALSEMMKIFEHHDFSIWDVENLRLHYARTLQHWLTRFEQHTDEVADMFDENFVRAWRLYLCGSIASFESGVNGLFQLLFAREKQNEVPWTRNYVYSQETSLMVGSETKRDSSGNNGIG